MKWSRAVHHVESLATTCADMATRPATIFPLRVTELWVFGDILGIPGDIEFVDVALCADLPPADVAWRTEPHASQHWANATRLAQNPTIAWWRSAHAPVWNHRIERPLLIWDMAGGVREDALAALREGEAEGLRAPAPSPAELLARLTDELAICLDELRACTAEYEDRRWKPGKLAPYSDALALASAGYLDLLDALGPGTSS